MTATYSTKRASELTGASRQAIRVYTSRYREHFDADAKPEPGQERRFTADDLRLIAYVYQQTQQEKRTHGQVLADIATGALGAFDWEPPTAPQDDSYDAEATGTALVPIERLVAVQALLHAEREERERLLEREQELTERLENVRQQLGEAQGELKALKGQRRKPPAWWVRLFGDRE